MQRTTFYYDPIREGYDDSAWRTLYGAPVVAASYLDLSQSSILHYGDIARCDLTMCVNIPSTPTGGEERAWGLASYNSSNYARFRISGENFYAETSNGTTTTQVAITWQSNAVETWEGNDTQYRILWEGGTAKFYINDVQRAVITDVSVTGDPMSLYFKNDNLDNFFIRWINVKNIQFFYMHTGVENAAVIPAVYESDSVSIAESTSMALADFVGQSGSLSDALSVSESVAMNIPGISFSVNVNDALTITESVAMSLQSFMNVNDEVSITESKTADIFMTISLYENVTMQEGGVYLTVHVV